MGQSHERLYGTVQRALDEEFTILTWYAPAGGTSPVSMLRNMIAAWSLDDMVNHITAGLLTYLVFVVPGNRTIVTIHDCATLRRLSGWKRWIWLQLWYRWPLRRAEAIVAVSDTTRQEVERWVPEVSEKIRVLNNCIPEGFCRVDKEFDEEFPTILQVGTSRRKNLHRVAEALEGISCELRVIGPMSSEQRERLERSGIEYSSAYDVPDAEMVREYERADMLVFASTLEGFGMPIVEAQTVGRPVVTSHREPMRSVSGEAASLVDPESVASIRRGIVRVIEDREFRERCVERGLENAQRFQPEAVARRYAELYRDLSTTDGGRVDVDRG